MLDQIGACEEIRKHVIALKEGGGFSKADSLVVGISGAAALGKTTLARNLRSLARNLRSFLQSHGISAVHVPLDGYLFNRKTRRTMKVDEDASTGKPRHSPGVSGYNPVASRTGPMKKDLAALIHRREAVLVPTYSHQTGDYGPGLKVKPQDVIILDGIMALHGKIAELVDLGVFMFSTPLFTRAFRLLVDMTERKYTVFEALDHADEEFDEYMHWIDSQRSVADILLRLEKDRRMELVQSWPERRRRAEQSDEVTSE